MGTQPREFRTRNNISSLVCEIIFVQRYKSHNSTALISSSTLPSLRVLTRLTSCLAFLTSRYFARLCSDRIALIHVFQMREGSVRPFDDNVLPSEWVGRPSVVLLAHFDRVPPRGRSTRITYRVQFGISSVPYMVRDQQISAALHYRWETRLRALLRVGMRWR